MSGGRFWADAFKGPFWAFVYENFTPGEAAIVLAQVNAVGGLGSFSPLVAFRRRERSDGKLCARSAADRRAYGRRGVGRLHAGWRVEAAANGMSP